MTEYVLATGSAQSRAPALIAERLVNCLVEREDSQAKTQAPLFLAPGLVQVMTCGVGPIRGIWIIGLFTYVVSGTELYQVNLFGAPSLVGSGLPGTGFVTMTDNGVQLCMVFGQDDGSGWIFTVATNTLTKITSANYFPSTSVGYIDGYFLFSRQLSTEIFFSALFDGLTFNGTDFFNTESSSKQNLAIGVNLQLVFFFKGDKIEMWYDSGAADNPFQRYAGGVINFGCAAGMSVVGADGAQFFLGSDGVIYRLQANVPVRVSTHAIETIIAGEIGGGIDRISGFAITVEGHKLVSWFLPHQQRTIVFDVASGKWHERESVTAVGVSLGGWRAGCGIDVGGGASFVGDRFSGIVWTATFTSYTEGSNPIFMSVVSGVLAKDRKWLTVNEFQIDCQPVTGTPTPSATLYTSSDGATFTSRGAVPIPPDGDVDAPMFWNGLGAQRQWTFKITLNDSVQRVLIGARFDIDEGI